MYKSIIFAAILIGVSSSIALSDDKRPQQTDLQKLWGKVTKDQEDRIRKESAMTRQDPAAFDKLMKVLERKNIESR